MADERERPAWADLPVSALRAAVTSLRTPPAATPVAPHLAADAGAALASGRWQLVDSFERGGRYYVIACAYDAADLGLPPLTPRECAVAVLAARGYANKLIAYELGLSVASVATYLRRARSKLGVSTRLELITLLGESLT